MAIRLNPLSTAKGQKFECEICGKAAKLACQHCRVTYYCSSEHQGLDWFGIHDKVCQLLGALRTLRPTLGSEDERRRRQLTVQMSQHALIDLCRNEAQKHLVHGRCELAIPGALQALRFSMAIHGAGRLELVPSYLLLAEANLGLSRFKVAEEFLLYANWSVLKYPDCSNELKSQLFRNFGKLYAAQKRYDDALKQLAQDVYYSSLQSGPEHVDTAVGYYYMANVFLMKENVENALAFYDKVVDVWYKFLLKLRNRPDDKLSDYLTEPQISEAFEMLRHILHTRTQYLGAQHIATGEAAYTTAVLEHAREEYTNAVILYRQALEVYQIHLGFDHVSTQTIREGLAQAETLAASTAAAQPTPAAAAAAAEAAAYEESKSAHPVPEAVPVEDTVTTEAEQKEEVSTAAQQEAAPAASTQEEEAKPEPVPADTKAEEPTSSAENGAIVPSSEEEAKPATESAAETRAEVEEPATAAEAPALESNTIPAADEAEQPQADVVVADEEDAPKAEDEAVNGEEHGEDVQVATEDDKERTAVDEKHDSSSRTEGADSGEAAPVDE